MGLLSAPALDVVTTAAAGANEMVTLKPLSGVLSVISVAVKHTFGGLVVTVKVAVPVESVDGRGRRTTALTDVGDKTHRAWRLKGNPLPSLRITWTVALELTVGRNHRTTRNNVQICATGAVGGGVPNVTSDLLAYKRQVVGGVGRAMSATTSVLCR